MIKELQIIKGLQKDIDLEALSVIENCNLKWIPSYVNGEPVASNVVIPLTFKLTR